MLGIIQVLRHQEVPPTSLVKYDGVMMPVLGGGGWSSKLCCDDGILWQCFTATS